MRKPWYPESGDENGHAQHYHPDAGVHAEERADDAIDAILVSLRVGRDDVANETTVVSEVEQSEIRGNRGDEHPQSVLWFPEMVHREWHQEDADADVHGQRDVPSDRPPEKVRRRGPFGHTVNASKRLARPNRTLPQPGWLHRD